MLRLILASFVAVLTQIAISSFDRYPANDAEAMEVMNGY